MTKAKISANVSVVLSIREMREALGMSRQSACFGFIAHARVNLSHQCLALWEASEPAGNLKYKLYLEWLQQEYDRSKSTSTE